MITARLDSGAFSDPPEKRLTPAGALARQLRWEDRAARIWGAPFQAEAFVSYDLLIDEMWVSGKRFKRRWSVAEADRAVTETVDAVAYLARQREAVAPRRLILSCQGVDHCQYQECAEAVLAFAEPGDILGLGGFCILGLHRRWLPEFIRTVDRVLPAAAAAGLAEVHLFGVLWPPPLAHLLAVANECGLRAATDSSAPIINSTWKNSKKAGVRAPTWEGNVAWWQDRIERLRPQRLLPPPVQLALFDGEDEAEGAGRCP